MAQKNMNELVENYKRVLSDGDFQHTYQYLVGIVQNIRTNFSKNYKGQYSVSSILHGYVDVTYFYMQNELLKNAKLKLAIVLNHKNADFEIWLVAQTKEIQFSYWNKMKNEKWIDNEKMPQYSVFQIVLLENPDFNNKRNLLDSVCDRYEILSNEILEILNKYI